MKAKWVIAAAAMGLAMSAGQASAAITLETGSFGGSQGVHSVPGLNAASVSGLINGTDLVTLSTTGDTLKTSGGGLSKFEGGDGTFNDLLISFDKTYGKVTFNLNTLNKTTTSFGLLVNGVTSFSSLDYGAMGNGENKYILSADGLDSIKSLAFTFSPNIVDIRQIRVVDVGAPPPVSDVPEPATWGMLIVGFAGIGAMLRRARRRDILSRQAAALA